jgi:hypothetical protein
MKYVDDHRRQSTEKNPENKLTNALNSGNGETEGW